MPFAKEFATGFALETLRNDQSVGHVVREAERICYASLVTNRAWMRQEEWRDAPPFEI